MEPLDYEARKAALIAEIMAAFDGVPREDGVTLHETYVIDNYGSPEERAAARALDTESRWQDVPEGDIGTSNMVLIFLDPIGFRYYLPAYMIWCLKHLHSYSRGDVRREMEWVLSVSWDRSKDKIEQYEKFEVFNTVQSKAIAHFLLFLTNEWERYWTQKLHQFDAEDLIQDSIEERDTLEEIRQQIEDQRNRYLNLSKENDAQKALDRYWGQLL